MSDSHPWDGKKILVVDDSPSELEKIVGIYKEIGFDVVGTAADGLEALEKIKDLKPDVISLDILMPNMHGLDCYYKIQLKHKNLLVLFVTCLANKHEVKDKLKEEIEESLIVSKPADIAHIRAKVASLYGVKAQVLSHEEDKDPEDKDNHEEGSLDSQASWDIFLKLTYWNKRIKNAASCFFAIFLWFYKFFYPKPYWHGTNQS